MNVSPRKVVTFSIILLFLAPLVISLQYGDLSLEDEFNGAYSPSGVKKSGRIVDYELVASSSASVELFKGHRTQVWSYNGRVPGPIFRIKLGDTIRVKFVNKLAQPTTVHWHGLRIPNDMDGFPGVSQEPVDPGETFVYEFTPKDAGTFWFHPHVRGSEQLERGLYGVLLVEDEVSELYDRDEVWVIDDWLLTKDYQVFPRFITHMDVMHDGRWGNVVTVNGSVGHRLDLAKGERIRLRLVNASNARVYRLDFGDLSARVIAVDGMYVGKVFDSHEFALSPGNRLDLDIRAGDKELVYQVVDDFGRRPYELASIKVSSGTLDKRDRDFAYPVNKRVPVWDGAYSRRVDKVYVLDQMRARNNGGMMGGGMMGGGMMAGGMMGGGMMDLQWTLNGHAYPDYDPVEFEAGKFVKLSFVNESSSLHPMHLHSQFFKVLERNGQRLNEPFFRDTVLVGPRETVTVGMIPFSIGIWPTHCHIQEHSDVGMLTLIQVK